jgi:hypothetical protein
MINKKKVKIICGNTLPSRNTESFIELTNLFNNNNLKCTLYGPDEWHIDKCNGKNSREFRLQKNDIIIINNIKILSIFDLLKIRDICLNKKPRKNKKIRHKIRNIIKDFFYKFIQVYNIPKIKSCKVILSLQESVLSNDIHHIYKKIHICNKKSSKGISKKQDNRYFECPSIFPKPKRTSKSTENYIAIIQDLTLENNIDKIIKTALLNNTSKQIVLYGAITNPIYFYQKIIPIMQTNEIVKYAGFVDIEKIYESSSTILINDEENQVKQILTNKELIKKMKEKEKRTLNLWNNIFDNE